MKCSAFCGDAHRPVWQLKEPGGWAMSSYAAETWEGRKWEWFMCCGERGAEEAKTTRKSLMWLTCAATRGHGDGWAQDATKDHV